MSCLLCCSSFTGYQKRCMQEREKRGSSGFGQQNLPDIFSSTEHISLLWNSFMRGEIRGLSWERKSCFLRGLLLLRLCASGQLSYLLMVLVLGVGAAGSQESLKRGAGVWGKERSDMDMPIQPQARCRQAPGKILWDSAGRSRLHWAKGARCILRYQSTAEGRWGVPSQAGTWNSSGRRDRPS